MHQPHALSQATYVNVNLHAIGLVSANNGRHNDQSITATPVPDTSFLLLVLSAGVCLEIELESTGGAEEQHEAAEDLQQ